MRPHSLLALQRAPLIRSCVLAVCAAGLLGAAPLHAQNGGPTGAARVPQVSRDTAAPRTVAMVHQGVFNYVRIERAEEGAAPNQHPLDLGEDELTRMLGALRLGHQPLLNQSDLEDIVPYLVTALRQATAQQDVSFAVAGRHSPFGLLAARDVTTGRMFNTPQGLQLIVGLAHQPYEDQLKAGGALIPFEPGRRAAPLTEPVELKLAPSVGTQLRADWVTWPGRALAQAPTGVTVPAAVSPVQPAASATPADARFREISDRLKTLDRLRDAGLISPQEYAQKRKQIMDGL